MLRSISCNHESCGRAHARRMKSVALLARFEAGLFSFPFPLSASIVSLPSNSFYSFPLDSLSGSFEIFLSLPRFALFSPFSLLAASNVLHVYFSFYFSLPVFSSYVTQFILYTRFLWFRFPFFFYYSFYSYLLLIKLYSLSYVFVISFESRGWENRASSAKLAALARSGLTSHHEICTFATFELSI